MMETDVTSLKKKNGGKVMQKMAKSFRSGGLAPFQRCHSLRLYLRQVSHLTRLYLRFSFFSHLPSSRNAVTINKSAYKSALRSQEKDHVNTRYDYSDYMEVSSRFLCKL